MKKAACLLLAIIALVGCKPTSNSSSSTTSTSFDDPNAITINFYNFGAISEETLPIYTTFAYAGEKITKYPTEVESPDPSFTTFIGWSTLKFVLDENDLWDFENDVIPQTATPETPFELYAIWDA